MYYVCNEKAYVRIEAHGKVEFFKPSIPLEFVHMDF